MTPLHRPHASHTSDPGWQAELDRLSSAVEATVRRRRGRLRVLDLGCGADTHVEIPREVDITGIDLSANQLNRNPYLNERVIADITTVKLPQEAYDVIVLYDVLEHVSTPADIVRKSAHALAPGGVLVIGGPRVVAPECWITKFTPHRFHIWVLRSLFGARSAGQEDHGPFPTYLRLAMAPYKLKRLAKELQLEEIYESAYDKGRVMLLCRRVPILGVPFYSLLRLLDLITFARWQPQLSSFHLVFARRELVDEHAEDGVGPVGGLGGSSRSSDLGGPA